MTKCRYKNSIAISRLNKDIHHLVNDYRINLYEIAYLSDEQVNRFKSDFRFVADYFVQMRKYGEYRGSKDGMSHAKEVLELLGFLTDDDRFMLGVNEGKEIRTMCEALDIIEKRGEERGEKRGEKRGALKILSDLVKDGVLTISEAARRAEMTVEVSKKKSGIDFKQQA